MGHEATFDSDSLIIVGDILKYSIRPAQSSDYEFLFELKKAAEFEPIKVVFGWDEQVQRDIHADEWAEERPEIIEYQNKAIGSVLLQDKGKHVFFVNGLN